MVEGEDPDAWWKEIEPRTNLNRAEDELDEQVEESLEMEALPTGSNQQQVTVEAEVIRGEDEEEETKV